MSYFDTIYADHLLPHRARTVYMYLRDRGDAQQKCWPSIKTIALHCSCSENAARDAVKQLVDRGFIRKVATKQMRRNGSWRQSNNHYYILPLPAFPTTGHRTSRRPAAGDGGEMYQQDEG